MNEGSGQVGRKPLKKVGLTTDMARKKGGFGRFIGAITGTPYERLLKQVDKLVSEHEDDDRKLAQTDKLVDIVGQNYEENIDEEGIPHH